MTILNGIFRNGRTTYMDKRVGNAVNDGEEVTKRLESMADRDNPFDVFVRSLLRSRKNGKANGKDNHT